MQNLNKSILVVDDNEMNRDLLVHRLERQGYTSAGADNGRLALDMMALENFDLVLLDIMMPQMDGFAVLEKMKGDEKLREIPVIMLTAVNESRDVIRCIEMGANDYIVKPFDMVALRNRITRALLNRVARSEEIDGAVNWLDEKPPAILVVEDDEMSRELLESRMKRSGYPVVTVSNGKEALEHLADNQPDLVLLDIMMPDVNGFQVLESIKNDRHLKDVSVIMLSALDDRESIDRCMQMGAEDYITKPFNALILKGRVLSCLQAKRIRDRELAHQELAGEMDT